MTTTIELTAPAVPAAVAIHDRDPKSYSPRTSVPALPPVAVIDEHFRIDEEASPSASPTEQQPPDGATVFHAENVSTIKGKLAAINYAIFIAGFNDAATGALIPYLKADYDIGLLFVALVYLFNFAGWLVAAFTNVHLAARIGISGVMLTGSVIQLLAYVLIFWKPPYPVFVLSFFISGVGLAYQDAQANTFVGNVHNAHRWLGVLHGIYGLGALASPLIATAIAAHTTKWHYFYLIALGVAAVNVVSLAYAFRATMGQPVSGARETATKDLGRAISNRKVLLLSLFFFLNVGTEVTAGGWVVEFLISVRHGVPSHVGYVASGFWAGLTLGRFVLADVTHRYGDKRMILLYIALALGCQLIFWFVPNIIANAVMISLLGFFIAPFFPTGVSVATKLLPREQHVAAVGFVATIGQAGSAAFPFLTGAVAARAGVAVLQPVLVALLAAQGVVWMFIPAVKRRSV